MGQCHAKTKKGDRCRNDALGESQYCGVHQPVIVEDESGAGDDEWSDAAKTMLGLAIAAVIVCSYLVRGRF